MKTIISLLFLLVSILSIQAQTNFTIKGQIFDEDQQSIPFATLSLASDTIGQNIISRVAAADNGQFSFKVAKTGTYLITASFVGKKDLKKIVEVKESDKTIDLGKMQMEPKTTELGDVTITAQQPLVKVEIDKLVYNTSEDPESQTSNALDMLRKVPLVTVDGEDKIQVKGSGSYKVLVNGKPSNMFTNDPEKVFKSMPANSIKNVEVITEPGAKYDAEGVSAIINIITEKNTTDGYTGSVGAGVDNLGSYNGNLYLALKYGKIGFTGNGSYYRWEQPESSTSSIYKIFSPSTNTTETIGRGKYDGKGLYGSAILSYEIDSLNLLSLSYSNYSGNWNGYSNSDVTSAGVMDYKYKQRSENDGTYGGSDIGLDYQKSFKREGQLLTVSYKLGLSPYSSDGNGSIDVEQGTPPRLNPYQTNNETKNTEHTVQVDYVHPLTKKHLIEAGVKYIYRDNNSEGHYYNIDASGGLNEDINFRDRSELTQLQKVFSGYGSYQFKAQKFAVKTGVRFDRTSQDLEFANNSTNAKFFDFVPSAVVTYQLSPMKTLKGTYNLRIRRPGMWELNPYENSTDSLFISTGNPDLGTQRTHSFNVSYNSFSTKFMINASLGYYWTNNAIADYQYIIEKGDKLVTISTYDNIGKNQGVRANIYLTWNPNSKLKTYMNISSSYSHYERTGTNALSNGGFESNLFGGGSYNLPKDFRINFGGNLYQYGVGLQSSKPATGYSTYLSVTKELLDKKLSISARVRDPFWYKTTQTRTSEDPTYWSQSKSDRIGQSFGFSISYRFGELKSNIKTVQRGINNDDVSGGGAASSGGGQGGSR